MTQKNRGGNRDNLGKKIDSLEKNISDLEKDISDQGKDYQRADEKLLNKRLLTIDSNIKSLMEQFANQVARPRLADQERIDIISDIKAAVDRRLSRINISFMALTGILAIVVVVFSLQLPSLNDTVNSHAVSIRFLEEKRSVELNIIDPNPGKMSRIYTTDNDFSTTRDLLSVLHLPQFRNAFDSDWSCCSTKLVFCSINGYSPLDEDPYGNMYLYDFEQMKLTPLTAAGKDVKQPKISPDGKRIVFSKRIVKEDKIRWDLASISIKNKKFKWLTGENIDTEQLQDYFSNEYANWSPDGKTIIYCSNLWSNRNTGYYLLLMDKKGKKKRPFCSIGKVCHATFSPNGNNIVFRSVVESKYQEIWIAPVIGGDCVSDLDAYLKSEGRMKLGNLVKLDGIYFKKMTHCDDDLKYACGSIDPVWINNEEIMYLFTAEYDKTLKDKQPWYEVGWNARRKNVFTDEIIELPLEKAVYRNLQPRF